MVVLTVAFGSGPRIVYYVIHVVGMGGLLVVVLLSLLSLIDSRKGGNLNAVFARFDYPWSALNFVQALKQHVML